MTQLGVVFKPGDIVSAAYSFKKDKNEDLSFDRNDKLKIINIAKDSNWAHAKNSLGETGLIPLNYVQPSNDSSKALKSYIWYHGRITRPESEKILSGHVVGSFLVRDSDLYAGDLTLCVVGPPVLESSDFNNGVESCPISPITNVQHYHILRKEIDPKSCSSDNKQSTLPKAAIHYTLDEFDWFSSLPDLIQYYSVPESGLVSPLLHPVPDIQRKRLELLRTNGWIIPRKDLILSDQLGHGEFGEVVKATYRNRTVAVKMYKKTACKLAITYEASLMTNLDHPNLVSFVGFVYEPDEDAVYTVTEYLPHGNLLTYLHSRTRDEVTDRDKLQFSIDACRGLAYLEERGIVHRDIAARNILLAGQAPKLVAKVADFGMARDLNNNSGLLPVRPCPPTSAPPAVPCRELNERLNSCAIPSHCTTSELDVPSIAHALTLHDNAAIPVKWTAPEAVRKRLFSNKSDVWSFGVLLWEIYSYGRIPYPRMMANQALRQIVAGYRMRAPESCPPEIYALMRRTWHMNPEMRPTFAKVLRELTTHLNACVGDKASSNHRKTPPLQLNLSKRLRQDDPWLQKSFGRVAMTPDRFVESSSDCYDQLDELPNASATGIPSPPNPGGSSIMSRSFTSGNSINVTDTRHKDDHNPTITHGSQASTPETAPSNRTAFCLPRFERLKL